MSEPPRPRGGRPSWLISASTLPLQPEDGLPRFVLDLAEALSEHGRITVLAPHAPGAKRQERWGEVSVHRFPYFRPLRWQRLAYGSGIGSNLRRSWLARVQVPTFVAAQILALRRLIRREAVQLVNSHWILPQGLSAVWALGGYRGRIGHVASLHGGDVHLLARVPTGGRIGRHVLARTDAVLAVSSELQQLLERCVGRPSAARIEPMGTWTQRFASAEPASSPFAGGYLLFVGRLVAIKGVDVLLRALVAVREQHPELGLLVLGQGAEHEGLIAEADSLGLGRWVRFLGSQPHREVARYLRGCRAAVVPSLVGPRGRTEGMPTVVFEALAAGAPVVASAVGGIPDVLSAGGCLARPGDEGDLARQLLAMLESPPPPGEGQAVAAHYDWRRVAERYAEVFCGVQAALPH